MQNAGPRWLLGAVPVLRGRRARLPISAVSAFVAVGVAVFLLELVTFAQMEPDARADLLDLRPPRIVPRPEARGPQIPALLSISAQDAPPIVVAELSPPPMPDLSTFAQLVGAGPPAQQLPAAARAYRTEFGRSMDEDLPEYEADIRAWLVEWGAGYRRGEPWATRLAAP